MGRLTQLMAMMVTMATTRGVLALACVKEGSLYELVGDLMAVYTSAYIVNWMTRRGSARRHTCLDMIIFAIESGSFDWYKAGTEKEGVNDEKNQGKT